MNRAFVAVLVVLCGAVSAGVAEENFTFAVVGDPQPDFFAKDWWKVGEGLEHLIVGVNALAPDFLIIAGDLIVGHHESEEDLHRMWDNFDAAAAKLTVPLRLAVGNHDVWDAQSRRIWLDRYGPTYYSFDHEGCHFVVLDTENADGDLPFRADQVAWLKDDLEKHTDARHTFVFMHQPLWVDSKYWNDEIHPVLARHGVDDVFAGHAHLYRDDGVRDGVHYTITGGGQAPGKGRNEPAGGFAHYMLITVRGDRIHRAVVRMGSVYPADIVTIDSAALANRLTTSLYFDPLDIATFARKGETTLVRTITNPFDEPVGLAYRWDVPLETAWRVDPMEYETDIAPGETATVAFTLANPGSVAEQPGPTYTIEFTLEDLTCGPIKLELGLVNKLLCYPAGSEEARNAGVSVARPASGKPATDPKDLEAKAWVSHDEENLLFKIRVIDDDIPAGTPNKAGSRDLVAAAVYKDAPSAGSGIWTQCVIVRPHADAGPPDFQPPGEGLSGSSTRTSDGYEVNITIPFAAANLAGAGVGETFRCEIAVCDADDGEAHAVYQWNGGLIFFGGMSDYGLVEIR